tara:strand:+ start:6 stop:299 length:294 start_codon:yes stop_codon:yes gene_type:complete
VNLHALLLIVLFSCKSPESQEELEARCMPVLEEIIKIQHHRDVARKDFELTIEDYEAGRLREETWRVERNVWLERESRLAGDVNRLYVYSYETRCLE